MKKLATEIYQAAKLGKLNEPFSANDIRDSCPGWAYKTYNTFLSKHAIGNGKTTELFERVSLGLYCTIPKLR